MNGAASKQVEEAADERPILADRPVLLFSILLGGLFVGILLAAGLGAFHIAPVDIIESVVSRVARLIGIDMPTPLDVVAEGTLWHVRFPRVVLALLVGASLGGAGAMMQGIFANPLAEPGIVGVSSGAVLGAAAQIVLGFAPLGIWTLTGSAFLGGVVTVFGVYVMSRSDGRTEVVTLVLTGVAVNALAGAIIGLFTHFSDDAELRSITFWTLGSVANATWPKVVTVAPIAIGGLLLARSMWRQLDLLALGEAPARHLGVDVERVRMVAMAVVALLTAAAVAVSGIVLFVGLVIPHLVRMVAGPGHRTLIAASALGGALILVVGDLAARTLAEPAEIPLGVLTSLIGSPVFFWQLRRTRARQGGWA